MSPVGKVQGCHMPGGSHPLCSSCNRSVKEGVHSPTRWGSAPAPWCSRGRTYHYRGGMRVSTTAAGGGGRQCHCRGAGGQQLHCHGEAEAAVLRSGPSSPPLGPPPLRCQVMGDAACGDGWGLSPQHTATAMEGPWVLLAAAVLPLLPCEYLRERRLGPTRGGRRAGCHAAWV